MLLKHPAKPLFPGPQSSEFTCSVLLAYRLWPPCLDLGGRVCFARGERVRAETSQEGRLQKVYALVPLHAAPHLGNSAAARPPQSLRKVTSPTSTIDVGLHLGPDHIPHLLRASSLLPVRRIGPPHTPSLPPQSPHTPMSQASLLP